MVGSLANAKVAFDIVYGRNNSFSCDYPTENLPEGWSFVGDGATRVCYLGPDNVVYKVVYEGWGDDINLNEVKVARRRRRSKRLAQQGILIPKVTGHRVNKKDVVNAMEYIQGKPTLCKKNYYYNRNNKCTCRKFGQARICFDVMHTMLSDWGFCDMFSENVLYTADDRIYIIDLGSESW